MNEKYVYVAHTYRDYFEDEVISINNTLEGAMEEVFKYLESKNIDHEKLTPTNPENWLYIPKEVEWIFQLSYQEVFYIEKVLVRK